MHVPCGIRNTGAAAKVSWAVDVATTAYTDVLNRPVDPAGLATYACSVSSLRWSERGITRFRAHVVAMLCNSEEYYLNNQHGAQLTEACERRCGDRAGKFPQRFAEVCAKRRAARRGRGNAGNDQQQQAPAARAQPQESEPATQLSNEGPFARLTHALSRGKPKQQPLAQQSVQEPAAAAATPAARAYPGRSDSCVGPLLC